MPIEAERRETLRRFIDERSERLTLKGAAVAISMAARIVGDSPSLRAREREIVADFTDALARLLAEESGSSPDDIEPWVVANALMGVHRALVDYVRANVLAGTTGPRLVRAVRDQADRALAVLDRGLAGYPAGR